MPIQVESWQFESLATLFNEQPVVADSLFSAFLVQNPELWNQIVVTGVRDGYLPIAEAARRTGLSEEEVSERVRNAGPSKVRRNVIEMNGQGARLVASGLYVWEIIRQLRLLGSVEALREHFSLSREELTAARVYAAQNSDEVEAQINAFEDMKNRRNVEYPSLA